MSTPGLIPRLIGKYQRTAARLLFRRMLTMRNPSPIISFTFDDFPKSALAVGGEILCAKGLRGTYYASLGLMGQTTPTGLIFSPEDLGQLIRRGHELGCHTFAHCDSWATAPRVFEESVEDNRLALERLEPQARFSSLSYPITCPRPNTKRRVARRFACCRFGGQTYNRGTVDLNLVSAYFLEKDRDNPAMVVEKIAETVRNRGWLIIATHDIADEHTPYGCKPSVFKDVVDAAAASGAVVLPVAEALERIRG